MSDRFTFSSSSLPDSTRLVGFRGAETIGRPYEFEVFFTLGDPGDFDLADAVGSKALLLGDPGDGRHPLRVHGVLGSVELLFASAERALYRGLVVPHLWQLGHSKHSRLFTGKTVPEIIETILLDAGLSKHDFAFVLGETYAPEEHVCQYKESDLDFIHRWMEMEGIYYFFEHGDDAEKVIITDRASAHEPGPAPHVRYWPAVGRDARTGESLDAFACRHSARPAVVSVRDYDYAKPTLDLSGTETVSATGFGEVIDHAGRFFSPERGRQLAKIRAEELKAAEVVAHAAGTALGIRAGFTFSLEEHPIASYDTSYLSVEARHVGNQAADTPEIARLLRLETDDVYRVEVTAIRADVQYRLPRRTAWPRIYGYETGFIDGAADSDYAQIDDQGRYAVKFKFDESGLRDGQGSTWVRMMQPHGGGVEGWHFPLRKGVEVVVAFLGGDPDRPVISGVVPNALTPSPVTSGNHTKNVVQTGGRNRIEMEDLDGSQRMTLSTPHKNTYIRMGAPNDTVNMYISTDGNTHLKVGEIYQVEVLKETYDTRMGDITELFDQSRQTTVNGAEKCTVIGTVTEEYGPTKQTIKGTHEHVVKSGYVGTVDAGYFLEVRSESTVIDTLAGTTDIKSKGKLTMHTDNAAELDAVAQIELKSPVIKVKGTTAVEIESLSVQIKAPSVTIDGAKIQTKSGSWKGISGPSLEGYTTKNAFGLHKAEVCGVNMSSNYLKTEYTAMAMAVTSCKVDVTFTKFENASVAKFDTSYFKTCFGAMYMNTYGFIKW
jgi:type VI secretion system secreted protein VgrG